MKTRPVKPSLLGPGIPPEDIGQYINAVSWPIDPHIFDTCFRRRVKQMKIQVHLHMTRCSLLTTKEATPSVAIYPKLLRMLLITTM